MALLNAKGAVVIDTDLRGISRAESQHSFFEEIRRTGLPFAAAVRDGDASRQGGLGSKSLSRARLSFGPVRRRARIMRVTYGVMQWRVAICCRPALARRVA